MLLDAAHTCCFTGHRPEKLAPNEEKLRAQLALHIRVAAGEGYSAFISGMARGVDLIAAEAVLALRDAGADIKLICAQPYAGSCDAFGAYWRGRAQRVLAAADARVDVCPAYSRECYHIRNRWMLTRSSLLIAVFNGSAGGTNSTIRAATSMGLRIDIIMI